MSTNTCPRCGKDLTEALRILGDHHTVSYMHRHAHLRDDLDEARALLLRVVNGQADADHVHTFLNDMGRWNGPVSLRGGASWDPTAATPGA